MNNFFYRCLQFYYIYRHFLGCLKNPPIYNLKDYFGCDKNNSLKNEYIQFDHEFAFEKHILFQFENLAKLYNKYMQKVTTEIVFHKYVDCSSMKKIISITNSFVFNKWKQKSNRLDINSSFDDFFTCVPICFILLKFCEEWLIAIAIVCFASRNRVIW